SFSNHDSQNASYTSTRVNFGLEVFCIDGRARNSTTNKNGVCISSFKLGMLLNFSLYSSTVQPTVLCGELANVVIYFPISSFLNINLRIDFIKSIHDKNPRIIPSICFLFDILNCFFTQSFLKKCCKNDILLRGFVIIYSG